MKETPMSKAELKHIIKTVVLEELKKAGLESTTENKVSKDSNTDEGNGMDGVNVEGRKSMKNKDEITTTDLHEVMSRLGSNLDGSEFEFLCKLNHDVKQIHGDAACFADKDSRPGQTLFVVDVEPMLYYFRVTRRVTSDAYDPERFDVECLKMGREFLDHDVYANKPFSEMVEDSKHYPDFNYQQLLALFRELLDESQPLLESFKKMKRILQG